jgi:hypothetical protein
MDWIRRNCQPQTEVTSSFTVLIVPGDVATNVLKLDEAFKILTARFDAVCFTPGNHELWRQGSAVGESNEAETIFQVRQARDSIAKLEEVLHCAISNGVHVSPIRIILSSNGSGAAADAGESKSIASIPTSIDNSLASSLPSSDSSAAVTSEAVVVYPLHSWYHASWDTEPPLNHPMYLESEAVCEFAKKWTDFYYCAWPETLISDISRAEVLVKDGSKTEETISAYKTQDTELVAQAFASLNEPLELSFAHDHDASTTVISFSHFLPHQALVLEKRMLLEPQLPSVCGSNYLRDQVTQLRPNLHIFGHTHIPIDLEIERIRFIQWPLGDMRFAYSS